MKMTDPVTVKNDEYNTMSYSHSYAIIVNNGIEGNKYDNIYYLTFSPN
jgi:hypothetical protein